MNPSAGDLSTWPRNPLVRDSKRRPVVVLLSPWQTACFASTDRVGSIAAAVVN